MDIRTRDSNGVSDVKSVCVALERHNLKDVESVLIVEDELSEPYELVVPLPLLNPATGRPWSPMS